MGESLIGLSPVAADCWDRHDAMDEKGEQRDLPEPFDVPWSGGTRAIHPPVRPQPNAPLLMRLNRNPFALGLPWVRREAYREPRVERAERARASAVRDEAQEMRNRVPFSSPAEDRYVLAAPPTLRNRKGR